MENTETIVETAEVIENSLGDRVTALENQLAKTTKIAKRGAIGVTIAAVATVAALVWRKRAKKAQKKAEKAEVKAEEAADAE